MSLNHGVRDHWQVDNCPGADILRRDCIGGAREAALDTGETGLGRTIGFIYTTTGRACSASIAGVNRNGHNASQTCLVLNKYLELVERPISALASLLATNRSLSNTAQVFQSDTPMSALRFLYKPLANHVVSIRLESRLATGQISELAPCRSRALALEIAATMVKFDAIALDLLATEYLTVTVGGKVDHAKIDAQEIVYILRNRLLYVARGVQIKLAAHMGEIDLSAPVMQKFLLTPPTNKRNAQAARGSPD